MPCAAVISIIDYIQGGCDRVITGSAAYRVLPRAIRQVIVALTARHDVSATAAIDHIIAAIAMDLLGRIAALNVILSRPGQRISKFEIVS